MITESENPIAHAIWVVAGGKTYKNILTPIYNYVRVDISYECDRFVADNVTEPVGILVRGALRNVTSSFIPNKLKNYD